MNFFNLFSNQFTLFIPEIFLFLIINLLLIYGVIYNTSKYHYYPNLIKNIGWLSIQTLLITILLLINNQINLNLFFNSVLINTELTFFFKVFVLIISILCFILSFNYLKNEKINTFEYHILKLFIVLGSFFLISSNDLLILYLSIEISSLALYILAAYKKNSSLSTEAGLKYVILGSFSSGLYLFGSSLIYGFTGTINFTNLTILFFTDTSVYHGIILGLIFLFISLLFKLGVAPFHMWVPDIYEGIPTSVTLFLTTVPKIAIFSVLIRFCNEIFFNLLVYWQPLLIISSLLSIILGTFILINQKKIKRFLAYSSIVHMGYLLIGLTLGTIEGTQASILYLIIYMINTINIWGLLFAINYVQKQKYIRYLSDLNSLYKTNPILAFTFVISLFSMAGIPPLAGFFSKFYIFFAALENGSYIVLILGLLTSIIGSFYYIRIIKIIYFETKIKNVYYQPVNYITGLILGVSTLFLIFFFIFLEYFLLETFLLSISSFK
jgi:proton-translocating NADH-quinone oxidoreductase chain N